MKRDEIFRLLSDRFPDVEISIDGSSADALIAPSGQVPMLLEFLRSAPRLQLDHFLFLTAVDWLDRFELSYYLHSYSLKHTVALKTVLQRENPRIQSVSDIWGTAEWHENEAYDLFGIIFENHPWPRRILTPDDWPGYPMRKDYRHPNLVHKPWI